MGGRSRTLLDRRCQLAPLAPITNVTEDELPGLVERMAVRLAEPHPSRSETLTATYLLMGLRYSEQVISQVLEGVM